MTRTENAVCSYCEVGFWRKPSRPPTKTGDFCSTPCYAEWRREKNKRVCPICDEDFYPKRREQRFCSLLCATSRPRKVRVNGRGKNHKETLRKELFEKGWDGVCMIQKCKYNRTIDIHRLVAGKDGGIYSPKNIVALCPNHHAEAHRGLIKLRRAGKMKLTITEA